MGDSEELAEIVREQSRQIAALTAAVGALVPKVDAGAGVAVGELWTAYARTIAATSWYPRVVSMMKAPLAHFGARLVGELRPSDWSEYRDNVRGPSITAHGKPPAPGTVNLELRRLKTLFNWGTVDGRIARNPFHGIKPLPKHKRETTVSDDGLAAVLRCSDPMLRAIVLVGIDSGMRPGEVRGLRWDEIDFARGVVSLAAGRTKTKRARCPRLTDRALDAIRLLPRHVKSPFVFANPATGKPYSDTRIWQLWRHATADAGLEAAPTDGRVRLHDLRHSLISRMARLGIPLFVAMKSAGHQSMAQSWDYTHVTDEDLDDAKRVLDAAILAGPRRGPQRAAPDAESKKEQASKKSS